MAKQIKDTELETVVGGYQQIQYIPNRAGRFTKHSTARVEDRNDTPGGPGVDIDLERGSGDGGTDFGLNS